LINHLKFHRLTVPSGLTLILCTHELECMLMYALHMAGTDATHPSMLTSSMVQSCLSLKWRSSRRNSLQR